MIDELVGEPRWGGMRYRTNFPATILIKAAADQGTDLGFDLIRFDDFD
jgi:hypothetical protein